MITVVIPTYNRIEFIEPTLASIFQQKVDFNIEIIMVDDGSTDGTADWVEANFPTVKVIRQQNRGVSAARNVGVIHARADLVAFCDSDDLMLPGRLSAQYAFLNSHKSAVIVAGNFLDFNSKNGVSRTCRFDHAGLGIAKDMSGLAQGFLKNCIRIGNPIFSTGMFRKEVFMSLGGFAEGLRNCEDFELRARIATAGDVGIIDKPLMLVRNDSHARLSGNLSKPNPYESMVDYWLNEQRHLYRKHKLERTFFIPVMGVHWRGPSFNNCGGGVVQENDVGRDSRYCLQSL